MIAPSLQDDINIYDQVCDLEILIQQKRVVIYGCTVYINYIQNIQILTFRPKRNIHTLAVFKGVN